VNSQEPHVSRRTIKPTIHKRNRDKIEEPRKYIDEERKEGIADFVPIMDSE